MKVSQNSHIDFYVDLVVSLISCDLLNIQSAKNLKRDIETVRSRVHAEGLSFLTKTLPKLGKALEQGLETSAFKIPREFKSSRKYPSSPAFMQEYFKAVFDVNGCPLETVDPAAIRHVRQVCFLFYKLELATDPKKVQDVLDTFVRVDDELVLASDVEAVSERKAASYIAREILAEFDTHKILPRHGPGAVATGEKLDDKWVFARKFRAIHQVYPYYEYFVVGGARELIDRLGWYKSLQPCESGTAKVVLVPKDSRGPRLISCEPLEYQWIQQGLGRSLMRHLENHWFSRGHVNFSDQSVNRDLASSSSRTKAYATIDMKDASDRVSLALVREIFEHNPKFLTAIEATRTTATLLPDGRVQTLKKFAPMGSALCFPVESLVFFCLSVAAICRATGMPLSSARNDVYVYGDDIIVKTEYVDIVADALERSGLLVNRSKSFSKGLFRESCGMDAYNGVDVTPLKIKTLWTDRVSDGNAYVSYLSALNQLRRRGYKQTSDMIEERIRKTRGFIPYGLPDSPFPCIEVPSRSEAVFENRRRTRTRFGKRTHDFEFFVPVTASRKRKTTLDSWPRLLRGLTMPGSSDPNTIVVPRSMLIKRGWRRV